MNEDLDLGGLDEWADDLEASMAEANKFYRQHFDTLEPKTAFCLMVLIGGSLHGLFSAKLGEDAIDTDFFFKFAYLVVTELLGDGDDGVRH